jgi:ketosteroid isomerase-like protein
VGDHPNAAAARAAIEAFAKGDVETMAASIADDATWHVPGSNRFSGEFAGKPAVLGRFQQMGESGLQTSVDDIHDVVGNDEHVISLVKLSVTSGEASASTNAVWIMHVKDGVLHDFWGINDNQAEIDRVIG